MEQMPICETNTFSGADEIPRVLFKRDYYYHHYHYHHCVHKELQLAAFNVQTKYIPVPPVPLIEISFQY